MFNLKIIEVFEIEESFIVYLYNLVKGRGGNSCQHIYIYANLKKLY